jgi:thiomorpholine-carboxylate dehydrogenase
VIYLDEARVRELLSWPELISAMERALADFSAGRIQQPVRTVMPVEEGRRYFGVMPAVADDVLGLKAVTFYPANEERGIPTHHGVILLFRSDTGEPLAAMDGRLITEMRTAAVSAAITKRLMPPQSRTLALVGSGVQAHAHLEALRSFHDFEDVRVWSRTPENAARFAREHAVRVTGLEECVRDADVVVVVTHAQTPVVQGAWLKRGAHVNAVGANRPNWRELDDEAMNNVVLVDSREAAFKESGDVILSDATVYAEIGEIFAGTVPPPAAGATTIFKSLGLAAEDLASARLVLQRLERAP